MTETITVKVPFERLMDQTTNNRFVARTKTEPSLTIQVDKELGFIKPKNSKKDPIAITDAKYKEIIPPKRLEKIPTSPKELTVITPAENPITKLEDLKRHYNFYKNKPKEVKLYYQNNFKTIWERMDKDHFEGKHFLKDIKRLEIKNEEDLSFTLLHKVYDKKGSINLENFFEIIRKCVEEQIEHDRAYIKDIGETIHSHHYPILAKYPIDLEKEVCCIKKNTGRWKVKITINLPKTHKLELYVKRSSGKVVIAHKILLCQSRNTKDWNLILNADRDTEIVIDPKELENKLNQFAYLESIPKKESVPS